MRGYYTVWFANTAVCSNNDISWCVTVSAESEAEALELGLVEARNLNFEFGLPPNGIRLGEDELCRLVCVQPMRYA